MWHFVHGKTLVDGIVKEARKHHLGYHLSWWVILTILTSVQQHHHQSRRLDGPRYLLVTSSTRAFYRPFKEFSQLLILHSVCDIDSYSASSTTAIFIISIHRQWLLLFVWPLPRWPQSPLKAPSRSLARLSRSPKHQEHSLVSQSCCINGYSSHSLSHGH